MPIRNHRFRLFPALASKGCESQLLPIIETKLANPILSVAAMYVSVAPSDLPSNGSRSAYLLFVTCWNSIIGRQLIRQRHANIWVEKIRTFCAETYTALGVMPLPDFDLEVF